MNPDLLWALLWTSAAGACIPLGALLARIRWFRPNWLDSEFRHFVIALGGGVVLAAVALVLLPQGTEYVGSPLLAVGCFLLGGVAVWLLERKLGQSKRESPMLLATLLDYLPESLALGGAFAAGAPGAVLLALLIGLQNLPEGFNTYREMCRGGRHNHNHVLLKLTLLVPIGPLVAAIGWFVLADDTVLLGASMLMASGGLLYLVFQDIAPQSRLKAHWFPPMGAVCGFALALLGQLLLEH